MPLSLSPATTRTDGPLSIELDGVVPDRLEGLSPADIARMPVVADGRPCPLGDLFTIDGDGSDGTMLCTGDFTRVHRLAAGMRRGVIDVRGSVGRHAAEQMAGGSLTVAGDAGDWLAAEMSGGSVRIDGGVGDNAAAALAGSGAGMTGGLVVINGTAGHLAGARMRRGILAIGGDCGEAAAFEMLAGTVVVGGTVGRRSGMGMRRGSLVALSVPPDVPPAFRRGAAWCPAVLQLLAVRLAAAGFRPAATTLDPTSLSGIWQQWHGDLLAGGRGEIFHRPPG